MNINYETYFAERQLDFLPKHFVVTNTAINNESLRWIYEKLHGRFYLKTNASHLFDLDQYPCFEDPSEAVIYEITWA